MQKALSLLFCLLCTVCSWAITVKGTVTDEAGEPLYGATVVEVGNAGNGTSTDMNGNFTINVPPAASLQVSYIGYVTQTVQVGGQINLTIVLQENAQSLDEVVVVAFGKMKKEAFTGSAGVMNADELAKSQVTNAAQALAGRVAGVQITNSSGQAGNSPSITIRGIGSISSGTEPLIVVDGMPYDGDLSLINPNDIESMTVLKDAASNALYGARGANGVIMVTTKRGNTGEARVTFDAKWGVNTNGLQKYQKMNGQQFYENFYKTLYNYYVTDEYAERRNDGVKLSPSEAHQLANYNLMNTATTGIGPGYMVYTVPNGQDFIQQGGKMNPNATLGALYSYQGTELWLQPDDWYKIGLQDGFRQEYNASISGKSGNMNFYGSIGYLDQEGIQPGAYEKRLTARAKIDYQAKKWLKVGANFSYGDWKYGQTSEGVIGAGYLWGYLKTQAPIYPMYLRNADKQIMKDSFGRDRFDFGDYYGLHRGGPSATGGNPVFSQKYRSNTTKGNSVTANGYADFIILPELTVTINGSTYVYNRQGQYITPPYVDMYTSSSDNGYLSKTKYDTKTYNTQQLINYNKTFNQHEVSALLGHEYYKYDYSYLSGSGKNFGIDPSTEFGTLLTLNYPSSYSSTYNNEGYFLRGMYNYAHKYYANASFRRDASSRFAKNHRWGSFWSLGAAWMISHEDFFNVEWINSLKLKASVGSQGNDNIGNYLYADSYDIVNNNNEVAYQWRQKGSENITWETNTNWNAGVEFDFWNGRLSGSLDYFYRKTSDMLFALSTPPSAGYTSYYVNLGDMRNSGIELVLSSEVIKNRDFQWNIDFNISYIKNKVLKLPEDVKTNTVEGHRGYVNVDKSFVSLYNYYVAEGMPLYTWYLRKYAGVGDEGQALYYKDVTDENGNVTRTTTENANEATYYLCGDAMPAFSGGLGMSFVYRDFDLSFNMNYQIGGKCYDYNYQTLMSTGSEATGTDWHVDMLKAWTPENTNTDVPRLRAYEKNGQNATTDRFLTNASFLSIQNVNFGYTLPRAITKRCGIERMRVYFSGENLGFFTARRGLDPRYTLAGYTSPEVYPSVRTMSGGVQLTF